MQVVQEGHRIKGGRFWVLDFAFVLFSQLQGHDEVQLWILLSFLDQLCLWVGELGLNWQALVGSASKPSSCYVPSVIYDSGV